MDIYDAATQIEEAEREASVARVRGLFAAGAASNVVTLQCLCCGEAIDPKRIKALRGVTMCIDCATRKERNNL